MDAYLLRLRHQRPFATFESIGRYLIALEHENERVRAVLLFALLCVLEVVSYTRKDGQYLRWNFSGYLAENEYTKGPAATTL